MKIKVLKIDRELPTPNYKFKGDAGMDIYSAEGCMLRPSEFKTVGTGIKMAIPFGYEAQIRPRSGLAAKHGISIVNTPGTIDGGYRGEFKVILINLGKEDFVVKKGDRIAQVVFNKFETPAIEVVDELDDTDRGEGGFGSTGKS